MHKDANLCSLRSRRLAPVIPGAVVQPKGLMVVLLASSAVAGTSGNWRFDAGLEEWHCEAGFCHWDPAGVDANGGALLIQPFIDPHLATAVGSALSPCVDLADGVPRAAFSSMIDARLGNGRAEIGVLFFEDRACGNLLGHHVSNVDTVIGWTTHSGTTSIQNGAASARLRIHFETTDLDSLVKVDSASLSAALLVPTLDVLGGGVLLLILGWVASKRVRRLHNNPVNST